jgi:hypothetical protein
MGQLAVTTRVWRNLADAQGLGPCGREPVEVQILSPAQSLERGDDPPFNPPPHPMRARHQLNRGFGVTRTVT